MDKTLFLDLIERYYNSQLSRFQLQYFFTSHRYVAASCPRRGGKSFVTNLDSLYACTIPNKRVAIILPGTDAIKIAKREITEMVEALDGYIEIERSNMNTIYFNNNSTLYLFSGASQPESYRGQRLNKVTIEEPDFIKNIEDLEITLNCCMGIFEDSQLKMIGTHSASNHNLKSYMLSPYYEKIIATPSSVYDPINRETLNEMREMIGDNARFRLEFLNEVSPSLWNNTN